MTQQATSDFDPNTVRKSMSVQVPPTVAWRVFAEKMASWCSSTIMITID